MLLCRNRTYDLPITSSDALSLKRFFKFYLSLLTRRYSEKAECSFAGVEPTTNLPITSSDALPLSTNPNPCQLSPDWLVGVGSCAVNGPYSRGGHIGQRQSISYPEPKCLGKSFGAQKLKFSIPRDSTWPPCD